jgi:hypothetical protein
MHDTISVTVVSGDGFFTVFVMCQLANTELMKCLPCVLLVMLLGSLCSLEPRSSNTMSRLSQASVDFVFSGSFFNSKSNGIYSLYTSTLHWTCVNSHLGFTCALDIFSTCFHTSSTFLKHDFNCNLCQNCKCFQKGTFWMAIIKIHKSYICIFCINYYSTFKYSSFFSHCLVKSYLITSSKQNIQISCILLKNWSLVLRKSNLLSECIQ